MNTFFDKIECQAAALGRHTTTMAHTPTPIPITLDKAYTMGCWCGLEGIRKCLNNKETFGLLLEMSEEAYERWCEGLHEAVNKWIIQKKPKQHPYVVVCAAADNVYALCLTFSKKEYEHHKGIAQRLGGIEQPSAAP